MNVKLPWPVPEKRAASALSLSRIKYVLQMHKVCEDYNGLHVCVDIINLYR